MVVFNIISTIILSIYILLIAIAGGSFLDKGDKTTTRGCLIIILGFVFVLITLWVA